MNYLEKIQEIGKVCRDDLDFNFVEMNINAIKDYVNSVIDYGVKISLAADRYAGDLDRYKDLVTRVDSFRHDAHEAAIAALTSLNRFCENNGLEKFADINTNDRYVVAEFAGQFVNEVFNGVLKGGMDKAVELSNSRHYPDFTIHEH